MLLQDSLWYAARWPATVESSWEKTFTTTKQCYSTACRLACMHNEAPGHLRQHLSAASEWGMQMQARSREVKGLMEALQVTPPRSTLTTLPHLTSGGLKAYPSAAAKESLTARGASQAIWAAAVLGGAAIYEPETHGLIQVRTPIRNPPILSGCLSFTLDCRCCHASLLVSLFDACMQLQWSDVVCTVCLIAHQTQGLVN